MTIEKPETFGLYAIAKMKESKRQNFNNPDDIRPITYPPKVFVKMPPGTAKEIENGNEQVIEQLRNEAARKGARGTYQVRVNYGGVGGGRGILAVKHMLREGLARANRGFQALIQELEI